MSKPDSQTTKLEWLRKLLAEVKTHEVDIDYSTRWRIAAAIEPIIKELENEQN